MNYYRGDSRSPEIIFKTGFIASKPQTPYSLIKALSTKTFNGTMPRTLIPSNYNTCAQDVHPKYVVCLSSKFETAAMFPFRSLCDTYIYALELREAISISMRNPYASIPVYAKVNQVFDLHSLQMQQADYLKKKYHYDEIKFDPKYIGMYLHAYEAFAIEITPKRIIAALKIKRRAIPEIEQQHALSIDNDLEKSFAVEFNVTEMIQNPHHHPANKDEYLNVLHELNTEVAQGKKGQWKRTPSFAYGLGGTLLPVPSDKPELIWPYS